MSPDAQLPPGRGRQQQDISGGRSSDAKGTPPPPDLEYDELVDLEGYETDPLTADEWAAICLAEARDLAEVVE